jgi:hypothetical protein
MVIDEFNNDHFDHAGLGFVGGAFITAKVTNGRPIATRALPPGTPRWGSAWKAANAKWYLRSFGCYLCEGQVTPRASHSPPPPDQICDREPINCAGGVKR